MTEALGNLVLTDYLEFRWYVGGQKRLAAIDARGKVRVVAEGERHVLDLLKAFLQAEIPTVTGPRELAVRMAALAHVIREIIGKAFESEDGGGSLHQQMEAFRKVLLHDLTKEQFVFFLMSCTIVNYESCG